MSTDAVPHAFYTHASVPNHWEVEFEQQLYMDIRKVVILKVHVGQATEWCARMVVVVKKSGKPCDMVDF